MAKSQACKNRRIGARFEGDVRKALRNNGQFIYTKGVSSKGIDIFSLKDEKAMQLELKSHEELKNSEYKEAFEQLISNYEIVKDFLQCTNYKKENIIYKLVYYIRNDKLIIVDVDNNKREYIKTRNINIINFLTKCFKDNNII